MSAASVSGTSPSTVGWATTPEATMTVPAVPAVGERPASREFGPITVTDIVRYVGASGDFNPLHHDDAAARAAGFPGVFSVGMFQAALLATFATDWLGAVNVRRFTTRFKEQVWPGDVLVCDGEVTAVRRDAGGTRVAVALGCARRGGGVAIDGSAEFWLPDADVPDRGLPDTGLPDTALPGSMREIR